MIKQSAASYEGLRAPTEVTGPSSHGQAQQSASISQTTALSSTTNPTSEEPKVVTMSLIVTSGLFLVTTLIYIHFCILKVALFQPMPSQAALTDWIEHTSADGRT